MAQEIEDLYRQRNWELATEISLYLIEHPEVDIPQGAVITHQVPGDRRFNAWARRVALKGWEKEQPVVYFYVDESVTLSAITCPCFPMRKSALPGSLRSPLKHEARKVQEEGSRHGAWSSKEFAVQGLMEDPRSKVQSPRPNKEEEGSPSPFELLEKNDPIVYLISGQAIEKSEYPTE